MTRSTVALGIRFTLFAAASLLGLQSGIIFLDIFIETFFFDELGSFLIASALVWIVAYLKKARNTAATRALLWLASGLLTVQTFVIAIDLALPIGFIDEVLNIAINAALVWVVNRQRNEVKEK